MTKDEKKKVRKEYKDWFARRTSCRESEVMDYRRYCFKHRLFTIFIKNDAYYEARFTMIVYNKSSKKIVRRYDNESIAEALKYVCIWIADDTLIAYNPEQRID